MSIGQYLRSLRARLQPESFSLPYAGVRRVPGLRREEVAVLAGVSVDYYTRLEQGREKNPSAQIVEALCRGLALSGDERDHLFRLAGYQPPDPVVPNTVRPELTRLLKQWSHQAAFVLTGTLDVLAPNVLAQALFADFTHRDNLARMVFRDTAARTFYTEWERAAESVVATLRHNTTRTPASVMDPFIRELSEASAEFCRLWDEQQVRGKTHAMKRFRHRQVGELSLEYQAFDVPEASGWQIIIYDAEPGTVSAEALSLLGTYSSASNQQQHPDTPYDKENNGTHRR